MSVALEEGVVNLEYCVFDEPASAMTVDITELDLVAGVVL